MNSNSYFTCQELIDRHPHVKLWGWTSNKVGIFYRCLLVDGRKFGRSSRTLVTESSLINLMKFAYNELSEAENGADFFAYDEIMDLIPQTEYYRWSPSIIGTFCKSALLVGKRSHKESRNLVSKQSVSRLINFTNQRLIDITNMPSL